MVKTRDESCVNWFLSIYKVCG